MQRPGATRALYRKRQNKSSDSPAAGSVEPHRISPSPVAEDLGRRFIDRGARPAFSEAQATSARGVNLMHVRDGLIVEASATPRRRSGVPADAGAPGGR
jgi:hypothetical protein